MDLAISYEPEVFRAREIGLNVVSIGALVQRPLTSIISLPKAKIRAPKDLKGKTVGTAGIDYQTAYLETILAEAGVNTDDAKVRNLGFNLTPALLTGRVDAVLGAFWNYEGTELKMRGKNPQIIRMDEAGVPTYNELVLVANEDGDLYFFKHEKPAAVRLEQKTRLTEVEADIEALTPKVEAARAAAKAAAAGLAALEEGLRAARRETPAAEQKAQIARTTPGLPPKPL